MGKVYEELDDAKAEIEELKAELRAKTDLLENLKKSHNAQIKQMQEAKFKAEKLDQKLLQQEDEISEAKLECEDLKGNLNRKETIIKHLSATNDKLRADCDDKLKTLDEEKRGLLLALEEENEKTQNQEQQIYMCKQDIERLKGCLLVSKDKSLESEKKNRVSKELRERDDMLQKLEEESRKVEDQLKWKKEQFKHLEEAHDRLRQQFKSCKKEWEMEQSTLIDEISSLQTRLDSQTRISEDLQHQIHSCHQALAHVESQKKRLEVEVSNLKVELDDASNKYLGSRLQLDCLNTDRDEDIADLRYLLKTKEAYNKESKYRIDKLEQENQELRMSLKELQEAQIQEAGASYSHSKLRSRLRSLEQTHRECSSSLKAKEAEWNSKLKQLTADLNTCQSELETKIEAVEGLQMELERSQSLSIEMKLLNEEMSVTLLVLKQGISEAHLKHVSDKDEMDLINKAREEEIFQLMKQLEMKDAALMSAQKSLNEEREIAACFREGECNAFNNELLQNELEESTMSQLILKEKVLHMECNFKEQLKEIHDALDSVILELDETICERNEVEFELQIWKSIVERLKNELEENHVVRRELEASLLVQVDFGESLKQEKDSLVYMLEEKERSLNYQHQQVELLEHELRARGESGESIESDNVRYLQMIAEKDKILEELQKEFEKTLIEKGTIERTFEDEKNNLVQLMKGKDKRMDELMQQVTSLEQQFTDSLTTFSLQLSEKQAEINLVREACDKITASQILAALEIEEKKLMVVQLEDDIRAIQQKLKLQEENWTRSEQLALVTEVELRAKQAKVMELNDAWLQKKLKIENGKLLENATRLSSERESLLGFIQGFSDKISAFSAEDTLLMDRLRSMVQSFENGFPVIDLKTDGGFHVKENMFIQSPTRMKKLEANSDTRSPFKELNLLEE
ncbi:hypothetical protein LR48_Vigan01g148000 [Vigna angularis]|uniref:Uncharacterized protein n=2 Tax=Phaseolus angularis TaxID=3914 RepID=A0A0L9TP38_PHAAN|nr:uncharacterized protein At4g38062 [Vigna angularis]KOM31924.1 hypothetical protein LR48_Vigan01g148000 [Vigna angularis]BAT75082.1 hypothetical protein VIGAN_01288500 [Vigna angularis var. angularis]